MDSLIGKTVDSYQILEVIGRGGMGVVYKAMDTALEKIVALKMMDPNLAQDEAFLKRFRAEAKALAKLENPHIVNVYAFRETEYGLFIVMEYVDGITLADKISQGGPLPWRKALPIFQQILSGLGHAHQAGVLHRDVKPRNILITADDTVKIMDFGLAKIMQASDVTVTQTRAGTLYYMSPERVKGLSKIDHRSDLYSLGMTFYEVLTGTVPFDKEAPDLKILETIVKGEFPPPTQYNSEIPKDLSAIIMKSLQEEPANRFDTSEKLSEALKFFESKNITLGKTAKTEKKEKVSGQPAKSISSHKRITRPVLLLSSIIILFLILIVSIPPLRKSILSLFPSDTTSYSENVNISKLDSTDQVEMSDHGSAEKPVPKPDRKLFSPARLTLQVIPSGSIFINGELRLSNTSQKSVFKLEPGEYKIDFRHPKYGKNEYSVRLGEGQDRQVSCYFERYINIQSLDENDQYLWSTVIINGQKIGEETPVSMYPLSVGSHKITVSREGYQTVEGVLNLEINPTFKEEIIPLVFHLKKL
ncbi:MAG: serine/threonine protein kinase [bacterium]|nr:MAG: serine/threonine protein kinase [bacterium]